jgi:hypothetical protein
MCAVNVRMLRWDNCNTSMDMSLIGEFISVDGCRKRESCNIRYNVISAYKIDIIEDSGIVHNEVDIGLPELKPHVPWKLKCVPVSLIKLMPWESGIQGC